MSASNQDTIRAAFEILNVALKSSDVMRNKGGYRQCEVMILTYQVPEPATNKRFPVPLVSEFKAVGVTQITERDNTRHLKIVRPTGISEAHSYLNKIVSDRKARGYWHDGLYACWTGERAFSYVQHRIDLTSTKSHTLMNFIDGMVRHAGLVESSRLASTPDASVIETKMKLNPLYGSW